MITQFLFLQILVNSSSIILADFTTKSDLTNWFIVNDAVMGGISDSGIYRKKEGIAVFKGSVSLANNGGFCMVKHPFKQLDIQGYSKIILKIKGDGKRYQIRLKSNNSQSYSYIHYFLTDGDWQMLEIPLSDFQAFYRGRNLNYPNYEAETLSEIAFLIGNKTHEEFELQIMWISLK